jgi:hypothetical protein
MSIEDRLRELPSVRLVLDRVDPGTLEAIGRDRAVRAIRAGLDRARAAIRAGRAPTWNPPP